MISAQEFLSACKTHGLRFFSGTPCSYLKPFINAVINDGDLMFRDACNEGDAVALAAGACVGSGKPGVVMFQNSGLGNAVNALTSLNFPFKIPVLLIVTHRGQPGGPADEPQHELMGQITGPLLETLRIPWEAFPVEAGQIEGVLERAQAYFSMHSLPYALVMAQGSVAENALQPRLDDQAPGPRRFVFEETLALPPSQRPSRAEALQTLLAERRQEDLIIATTGYTGRELYTLADEKSHLYMVGSMGSASAFALGLALQQPKRRVWVADGDGAALMRMGNLATIGASQARNLYHLVLDNEVHDSTGGQSTVSRQVSFGAIAQACSYAHVLGTDSLEVFTEDVRRNLFRAGPSMTHLRIRPGTMAKLGRPKITPAAVKERMMQWLLEGGAGRGGKLSDVDA